MEMVFSSAELSSWRLQGEAGWTELQLQEQALGSSRSLPRPAAVAVGKARSPPHATAAHKELLRRGGRILGCRRARRESYVVILKGWSLLPLAKCQVAAHPN